MDEVCGRDCGCRGDVSRRELLQIGAGSAGVLLGARAARSQPGDIPAKCREKPPQNWFDALHTAQGPITYTGKQLEQLIFPLGGIGTGSVWLNGHGKLVNWQIFNNIQKDCQVDDTFFAVRVRQEGRDPIVRVLQKEAVGPFAGIADIAFVGRYPIGTMTFRDEALPVDIELEAFNPLVPLQERESAIPCAILTVRAINKTDQPVEVAFLASLQNAVGHAGEGASQGVAHAMYGGNMNTPIRGDARGGQGIAMRARPGRSAEVNPPIELITDHAQIPVLEDAPIRHLHIASPRRERGPSAMARVYWIARGDLRQIGGGTLGEIAEAVTRHGAILWLTGPRNPLMDKVKPTTAPNETRRETVFADFDASNFGLWKAEGQAFKRPATGPRGPQNEITGYLGAGLVNSFDPDDHRQGMLTSPEYTIRDKYISFLIGGGEKPGGCAVNLIVDGNVVRAATGKNSEHLERAEWDVEEFIHKDARLQIIDHKTTPWSHILVDDIRFSNLPVDAITHPEAEAWNALLDALENAPEGEVTGYQEGKLIRQRDEPQKSEPGTDRIVHRDRLVRRIAELAGAMYRPASGRPSDAPSFGSMCLVAKQPATLVAGWTERRDLYQRFEQQGVLDPADSPGHGASTAGPTDSGTTVNGALCVRADASPRGRNEATFVMTWYFPNQYYPQNAWKIDNNPARKVGTMYANWFRDAEGVARYVMAELSELAAVTKSYVDALYDTSLPNYLADAVGANVSILRSPTCFWTKDGTFYGFEGCNPQGGGCCPMNCNHVWNYEQTLAALWPGLERNMRVTSLKYHQRDDGGVHHRVTVPRDLPEKYAFPVADGQCGEVLKVYREYRRSANRRFLDDHWPVVCKAMDFAMSEWDPNGDGVMERPQFNTYDRVIFGENTFVSSLYLAALRAAEEMARLCKDQGAADRYRARFEKGRQRIGDGLFNGAYYIQNAEDLTGGYNTGCWSDQVVGAWWARLLDLGEILPQEQVRSALRAIFTHNWLWRIDGFEGTQRFLQFADGQDKGLLCGSWPRGGRPKDPIHYRDECWTGIEYQVAAHKLYEGQVDEALAMVRGVRERYDGTKRSPWNEIECGDYYARALSSWSLLLAAQGFTYDGPADRIGFKPVLQPENHRSLVTLATAWGRFEQTREAGRQMCTLHLLEGQQDLRTLEFRLPEEATDVTQACRLNDRDLVAEMTRDSTHVTIHLPTRVTAMAGDRVSVLFTW